jgi:hypothetical protein
VDALLPVTALEMVHASTCSRQSEGAFCNVLGAALDHAARAYYAPGELFELVGLAAHHDHLQAVFVVEMDVQGRANLFSELVLERGQALRKLTDVMVVDERQCRKRRHVIFDRSTAYFGTNQIPKQLGAIATSGRGDRVELFDQAGLHRHAKAHQTVFHRNAEPTTAQRRNPLRPADVATRELSPCQLRGPVVAHSRARCPKSPPTTQPRSYPRLACLQFGQIRLETQLRAVHAVGAVQGGAQVRETFWTVWRGGSV